MGLIHFIRGLGLGWGLLDAEAKEEDVVRRMKVKKGEGRFSDARIAKLDVQDWCGEKR